MTEGVQLLSFDASLIELSLWLFWEQMQLAAPS
jgi:hypothetical protein